VRVGTGYQVWISRPRRRRSGEVDFGVHWRLAPGVEFPRWRVSWIEGTGDFYAVELTTDRYIVLGHHESREGVEAALDGWAEGGPKSLAEWFGVGDDCR